MMMIVWFMGIAAVAGMVFYQEQIGPRSDAHDVPGSLMLFGLVVRLTLAMVMIMLFIVSITELWIA
jgi:hypothetical protein